MINECKSACEPYMTSARAMVAVMLICVFGMFLGYLFDYGCVGGGAELITKLLRKIYGKTIKNDFIMGLISFGVLFLIDLILLKVLK
jgi:hypothetical protein